MLSGAQRRPPARCRPAIPPPFDTGCATTAGPAGEPAPEGPSTTHLTVADAEPAFLATPAAAALRQRGHVFAEVAEIGAATGIAFGPPGRFTAAAEPVRRGGGGAMVVHPDP